MSSVEQKIREVQAGYGARRADAYREHGDTPAYSTIAEKLKEEATQAILQIIESDVIEPIEKGHGGGNWRRLVVQVRANLREDK